MPENTPFISVVIPVKNEAPVLRRCLESLKNLDYPADRFEIIVADGLSKDNSSEIAREYGAKVVVNDVQTATAGRNRGFMHARGEIIAFTDADCVFDRGWLINSLKYFSDNEVAGVSGATSFPEDSTAFEKAVNIIFSSAEALAHTAHAQTPTGIKEVSDLPGCNAIYRKEALQKVMPIDEDIIAAEDVWISYLLKGMGFKLMLVPDVIVRHYRRSNPKKFIHQAYWYAIARLEIGKKSSLRLLSPLHVAVGLGLPIFVLFCILAYLSGLFILYLKILAGLLVLSVMAGLLATRSILAALNAPLAFTIFVFFWSVGFLRELFFPIKDARGK